MLRIAGGKVYDPSSDVHGEVRDVCISDGRIVSQVEGAGVRTIDATGMVVFPAAC
jgi:formylmethanofuran dehydrogenase subunit A